MICKFKFCWEGKKGFIFLSSSTSAESIISSVSTFQADRRTKKIECKRQMPEVSHVHDTTTVIDIFFFYISFRNEKKVLIETENRSSVCAGRGWWQLWQFGVDDCVSFRVPHYEMSNSFLYFYILLPVIAMGKWIYY